MKQLPWDTVGKEGLEEEITEGHEKFGSPVLSLIVVMIL